MNGVSRVTIGELTEDVTKGTTPTSVGHNFSDDGIPFVRVQNLSDGKVNLSNDILYIDDTTHRALSRSTIRQGDVLVSIAGTIGRAAISMHETELNCNQAVAIVRFGPDVDKRFVLHWLSTKDAIDQMRSKGVTGTITNLSLTQIKSLKVPLPPLPEQKRIASILDAADALRAKRRESIAQLDTLLQSTFLDMFGDPVTNPMGWEAAKFGDLGKARLGKMLDRGKRKGHKQFPYLANYNVQWGRFELSELREMEFSDEDRIEFSLQVGDLLICEGGEIGRTAIWRAPKSDIYFQKALHRVRLDSDKATSEYIEYYMRFMAANGGFRSFTNTATIAHLTGVKLKNLSVPLPSLELQQKFSNTYFSIATQAVKHRRHLHEINTLFASLQQRAFNGQL